jgi:hypothetical protein
MIKIIIGIIAIVLFLEIKPIKEFIKRKLNDRQKDS